MNVIPFTIIDKKSTKYNIATFKVSIIPAPGPNELCKALNPRYNPPINATISNTGAKITPIPPTANPMAVPIAVNPPTNVGINVPSIKIRNTLAAFNAVPRNLIIFPLNNNTIPPIIERNTPIFFSNKYAASSESPLITALTYSNISEIFAIAVVIPA